MDADAPLAPDPPPYVYAASDIRPRQTKEIELCEQASHWDWQYAGGAALAFAASVYVNLDHLKHHSQPGVRLIGPALEGLTWGGLLSGSWLSLPKCDPLWAEGPPAEGNVRAVWPLATAITVLSGLTAPIMDYTFLGPIKLEWTVTERSARVFVAAGAAIVGSLLPYLLPPRTWSARKQIDRMRIEGSPAGAALTYNLVF